MWWLSLSPLPVPDLLILTAEHGWSSLQVTACCQSLRGFSDQDMAANQINGSSKWLHLADTFYAVLKTLEDSHHIQESIWHYRRRPKEGEAGNGQKCSHTLLRWNKPPRRMESSSLGPKAQSEPLSLQVLLKRSKKEPTARRRRSMRHAMYTAGGWVRQVSK